MLDKRRGREQRAALTLVIQEGNSMHAKKRDLEKGGFGPITISNIISFLVQGGRPMLVERYYRSDGGLTSST